MRRAARTDQNHAAIVEAFRAHGWSVQSLAAIGKGCPDLLVGKYGRDHVVEVKTVKGKLTDDEAKWIDAWRGTVFIVRTVADVARFNSEAIAALAPSANRFDCPQCGQGIAVDEDGCCRSCGADAKAVTADRAAAAPAPKHHKTGEPLPGWDRAAAPAPDGLDKLRQRVSDYLPNAGESLAKRLVMDLVAEVERLELRRLQLETANSEIAEANDERPVLSDEVLRAMAEEWQADIKQDCELGYINPGLVAFARAVLARQQAER